MDRLIAVKHTCAVKSWTIQDNFNLVCMIIEKIDAEGALVNLDPSKPLIESTIDF